MTTPTLPELRANAELTEMLKRVVRIEREYIDHGWRLWEEPECIAMKDNMFAQRRATEAFIVQLGSSPAEAKKLSQTLLDEWYDKTNSIQQRAWMSLEQAMTT